MAAFSAGAALLIFLPDFAAAQDRILVWSDEFSGSSIDLSHWQFGAGASNDNVQYYTNRTDNAVVTGGMLQIVAKKESYSGYNYTSALLETHDAISWKYGRIEARIKLPGTPGFVPAFWLLPEDGIYGWWPYSGEIDIMEYPTTQGGTIYGTIHSEAYSSFTGTAPLGSTLPVADAETAFHIYAVEWTPEKIDFFVDQNKYFTVTNEHLGHQKWPFDQPFYIILNLAVGGGWVGSPTQSTVFPATMFVDYVRVYQTLSDIGISGKDYVQTAAQGVTYALPQIAGGSYAWTVPSTAQVVSGQGTFAMMVNWGNSGGTISAVTTTSSGVAFSVFPVEVSNNLLCNPGFEKGVKYWKSTMSSAANGSFALDTLNAHSRHCVKTIVKGQPTNPWDVQISQQGFSLVSGKKYEARLWARSATSGAKLNAAVINPQVYTNYGGATYTLNSNWVEYTFQFTASQNATGSFNLDLGTQPATYYLDDLSLIRLDSQSGIEDGGGSTVPLRSELEQNYPNPFNPKTGVRFSVLVAREAGAGSWGLAVSVKLNVYDALGREVAVLVNERKQPGSYEVYFDGSALPSGMYFYKMTAGKFTATRKMLLVR